MVDTTVKYFTSAMAGAPTLNNVAGSLIAVLDACLVNGFGLQTCSSVVIAGGVGTATIAAGHSAIEQSVVLFSGATAPAALNGERKVTSVGANTIIFDASDLPDGTVTGTITVKLASAGWAKAFSGTNLAAYKSSSIESSGCYLQVTDTSVGYASVRGFEAMSTVASGSNMFPTASQQGTNIWPKASTTAARDWFVIGNDRFFYFGVAPNAGYADLFQLFGFGDLASLKSGDAYRCSLWATNVSSISISATVYNHQPIAGFSGNAYSAYCARGYYGIGSPVAVGKEWLGAPANVSGVGVKTFPNPADNAIIFNSIAVTEGSGYRGELPGIFGNSQAVGTGIANGALIYAADINRTVVWRSAASTNAVIGGCFFDLTGPWKS